MANYHIGSLIRRLRKQKNMSQEDLAYPIMDRATLSKIESGKSIPNPRNVEALFERLGYNPHNIIDFFLNDENLTIKKITDELEAICINMEAVGNVNEQIEHAEGLLSELENNESFMESKLNQQYVLTYKAILLQYAQKLDNEKIMDLLMEAIEISIPEYDEQYIGDYHITRQELRILVMVAKIHYDEGRLDDAFNVMHSLKKNMDKHCVDQDALGKSYPAIIQNITICLTDAKRYDEAIKMCDEGIAACKETGYLYALPSIVSQKAECLFELGDKKACLELITQVFHTADMFGQYAFRDDVKEFAKEKLGVDL